MIRLETNEAEKQLRYFYKRPAYLAFGTFFILGFGMIIPIFGGLALGINPLWGILAFFAIVIFTDRYLLNKKMARAKEVYQYGDEVTIYLESESRNYGKTMNGMPERVINIRKNDELVSIKTFSPRVIGAFSIPQQKAYVYDKYPDIILPEIIFSSSFYNPAMANEPRQKSRSIEI